MKIIFLLVTILLLWIITCSCKETFIGSSSCEDDPEWFTINSSGNQLYCSDIGTSASCYDRDIAQREGWERCLKTCGNCADTQITRAPMNRFAMFSGDPYETFGIVLGIDPTREYVSQDIVGEEGSSEDIDDLYVDDGAFVEDIVSIEERLNLLEDFNQLFTSGTLEECSPNNECPEGEYSSCIDQCLVCPENDPIEMRTFIKQTCEDGDCNIMLPTYQLTCNDVVNGSVDANQCSDYKLFETISSDGDDGDDEVENNFTSLYDMCPKACNKLAMVEDESGVMSMSASEENGKVCQ